MFLKFLQGGRPVQFMVLLLFAVLFWLKYFILHQPVQMSFEASPMPLFQLFSSLLVSKREIPTKARESSRARAVQAPEARPAA